MKIIGAIICIIGILCFWGLPKLFRKKEEVDYEKYPIAIGTVCGTEKVPDSRWIVRFVNENGEESMAMDDRMAYSTFHPEKYHIPKKKTQEKIYYWKRTDDRSVYKISGYSVDCYFHFCDESLYELTEEKENVNRWKTYAIGGFIIACGLAVLLFGY